MVEGVCALHLLLREAYDLRVWVEAPRWLRLARGVARDGEGSRQRWERQWIPSEDRYVQRDDPISAAEMIVDGSEPLAGGKTRARRPEAEGRVGDVVEARALTIGAAAARGGAREAEPVELRRE